RFPSVIARMLRAFRAVRSVTAPIAPKPVDTIQVFNGLLLGSRLVKEQKIEHAKWRRCQTVGDALRLVPGLEDMSQSIVKDVQVYDLLDMFTDPDPMTQYVLDPELLIRHASGYLYQEAHFELERIPSSQLAFEGLAWQDAKSGVPKRDARFTPPSLARTIVQQAFDAFGNLVKNKPEPLRILDPACGSGVFLQEAIRELAYRKFNGTVIVTGFDNSDVSCAIATFCLKQAIYELEHDNMKIDFEIEMRDALTNSWGKHDIVLMNPPFMSWERMSGDEKSCVNNILGDLVSGRVDKAMAFIWNATKHLSQGGVVGTILPGPLLNNDSGFKWRGALQSEMMLSLIGKFSGYGYFPGTLVEPAFIIMQKFIQGATSHDISIRTLLASEGHEDESLRFLRRNISGGVKEIGIDIADRVVSLDPLSWMPKSSIDDDIRNKLQATGITCVGDLFSVFQGAKTGKNGTFVLTQTQINELPRNEHKYFRPAAGSKSIDLGTFLNSHFVFYPYNNNGATIGSESDLSKLLPQYYKSHLLPAKDVLIKRPGFDKIWWMLTRPRNWQMYRTPKLISKSFGQAGSFAYDKEGDFIVVQGYAWLWKSPASPKKSDECTVNSNIDQGDEPLERYFTEGFDEFDDGQLPWAYLALLNSPQFERLLGLVCPRVQGGQFDLASKYIHDVYLPDLSVESSLDGKVVRQLATMGRAIWSGDQVHGKTLAELVAKAYGIPLEQWGVEFGNYA
ncbi:MAG: N-6 DNA methylase, partial [Chthonomonadales bacterium]